MLGTDIVICIVGNKTDLNKDRNVSSDVAERLVKIINKSIQKSCFIRI